jgi:hypothetical protein
MREDVSKLCMVEIESHVERLFEMLKSTADRVGERFAFLPYLDDPYQPAYEPLIPHLQRQVCAALVARQWFQQHAPSWAPELPLCSVEIEKLVRSKSPAIALVGYFAASLAACNWDIEKHPPFQIYAAGAMGSEFAPTRIRADPKLTKKFPPRKLPEIGEALIFGLSNRRLEFMHALMRSEEHLRRCGIAEAAKEMRGLIEQLGGVKLDKELADFLDSQPPLVNR